MENLPKVLVISLEELLNTQTMFQWNVASNNGVVTVTMRFGEGGHNETMYTPFRKSPALIRRNHSRLQSWRNTNNAQDKDVSKQELNSGQVCDNLLKTAQAINSSSRSSSSESIASHHDRPTYVSTSAEVHEVGQGSVGNVNTSTNHVLPREDSNTDQIKCEDENETVDTIDPKKYFTKVVADFRGEVTYLTMRGISHSGNIVQVQARKTGPQQFQVHWPEDESHAYDMNYQIINKFSDVRNSKGWVKQVQVLCEMYRDYLEQENIDKWEEDIEH